MDCVGRGGRGRGCVGAGDRWIEVSSMLEGSLSSGILAIDLDFLQAEDMRPVVAGQKVT